MQFPNFFLKKVDSRICSIERLGDLLKHLLKIMILMERVAVMPHGHESSVASASPDFLAIVSRCATITIEPFLRLSI